MTRFDSLLIANRGNRAAQAAAAAKPHRFARGPRMTISARSTKCSAHS